MMVYLHWTETPWHAFHLAKQHKHINDMCSRTPEDQIQLKLIHAVVAAEKLTSDVEAIQQLAEATLRDDKYPPTGRWAKKAKGQYVYFDIRQLTFVSGGDCNGQYNLWLNDGGDYPAIIVGVYEVTPFPPEEK